MGEPLDVLGAARRLFVEHSSVEALRALAAAVDGLERRLRGDGQRLPVPLAALRSEALAGVTKRQEAARRAGSEAAVDALDVPAPSLLLSVPEVAVFELGVSESTVERLIREGVLPAVKVGRLTKVRRADLDAFVANLPPVDRAAAS